MTLYLCGFMGCGKSTIGKMLAKELGYNFIDLDSYISEKEGMSILQIFNTKGEKYFRSLEKMALHELKMDNTVIATGGGALTSRENVEFARHSGTIIFIDTSFKHCYERIKSDSQRPIASTRTKDELFDLYKNRIPFYISSATLQVDGNNSPRMIVTNIKESLFN